MYNGIRYGLRLSLYKSEKFFGPGVASLLRLVCQKGSLRMAAQEMGMAYSKAWRVIKTASTELGFPLLASQTGGKHGGGAQLTPEGQAFLERYTAMDEALQAQAKILFAKYF